MNRYILYLLWVAVILYYGLNVYFNNRWATGGFEVWELQEQVTKLKAENSLLREEILKRSSLSYLEHEARSRGFVDAEYMWLPL